MFDGQLDCRKMREADWNGTPDGISTRQSSTGGTLMTDSNANTASGKSKRTKLTEEERKERTQEYNRRYYAANKAAITKQKKAYYRANKEDKSAYSRMYYQENSERLNEASRQYHKDNKESVSKQRRQYRQENKEKIAERDRKYREANKEKIAERSRKWWAANKDRQAAYREKHKERYAALREATKERSAEVSRKWREENKEKIAETSRIYMAKRRREDNVFKLKESVWKRTNEALHGKAKRGSAVRDMGCTGQEACDHLESLFDEHMTWDNWGTYWHVDHIFPLAKANLEDRIEFLAVNNWRNLQPLEANENKSKGDSITPEAQELFESLKEEFSEHLAAQKERITCNQH